jgi:hypothetical protein
MFSEIYPDCFWLALRATAFESEILQGLNRLREKAQVHKGSEKKHSSGAKAHSFYSLYRHD